MVDTYRNQEDRVLASLSPEILDKLADLVVAKLASRNEGSCFPSKFPLTPHKDKVCYLAFTKS